MPKQLVPVRARERSPFVEVLGVERFDPHGAVDRVVDDREHVVDGPLAELVQRAVHGWERCG